MLDLNGILDADNEVKIFHVYGTTSSITQNFAKPRGAKLISIFAMGGGGAGGAGFSGASGTNRGGGGGGGSGSIAFGTFPAFLIPDILYVSVGIGGRGATASGQSRVSIRDRNNATSELLIIAENGGNGSTGTSGAGGAGGAAGAVGAAGAFNSGNVISVAGVAGVAGGAHTGAVGTSITALASHVLCGGAGGGGTPIANTDFAGGDVTGAGVLSTILGGIAGGGDGAAGCFNRKPFCASGGSGGGTNGASGNGGAGGSGSYGCGGGGGGAGVTGGAGGNGGDGLVIIITTF